MQLQALSGDARASSAAAGATAALLPLLPGHVSGQLGLRSGRASNEALPADVYADRSIAALKQLLVNKQLPPECPTPSAIHRRVQIQ